jgi:hypothetical protein
MLKKKLLNKILSENLFSKTIVTIGIIKPIPTTSIRPAIKISKEIR